MQKRYDIQIYELAYNKVPYGFWNNSLYTPLQCGAANSAYDICELKDNTGDNISDKNYFYSETTGTYWLWKNAPRTKYIGQCQYRRRLEFDENFDFTSIFNRYKIIVNKPIFLNSTLERQLKGCHPQIDIRMFENIVFDMYPEYAKDFNNIFHHGFTLFFSSSYIMSRELFNHYCSFMFPVLDEYFNQFGFNNRNKLEGYVKTKLANNAAVTRQKPLEYHMLIGGFLQERLFTTWILHNFKQEDILYKDFKYMDNDADIVANQVKRVVAQRFVR